MSDWPEATHLTDDEAVALRFLERHWRDLRAERLFCTRGSPSQHALDAMADSALNLAAAICEIADTRQREIDKRTRKGAKPCTPSAKSSTGT